MPKLKVNNTNLYYELHGAGIPLVLIGGLKSDHTNWTNVLDIFAKHHQVLIFDNRGAGQSDAPNQSFTIADMAEDLAALIDKLNLERPHILGHSMGGAIAQTLAAKYPQKINKLVLCNTFPKINKVSTIALENILDLHHANAKPSMIMKHIIPWAFSHEFLQTPDIVQTILMMSDQNPFPQTLVGYQRQLEALKEFNSLPWVKEIKNPTLIIAGEKDILTPVEDSEVLAKHIAHSILEILPGGHPSSIEQETKFTSKVIDFLRG